MIFLLMMMESVLPSGFEPEYTAREAVDMTQEDFVSQEASRQSFLF